MVEIIVITVLVVWLVSVIVYIIVNLFKKNAKLEKIVIAQTTYISNMSALFKKFTELSNKIDSKVWIQSDPEFLELFSNIKEIQTESENYVLDERK